MKRDELKALGIEDASIIDKIMELNGNDVNKAKATLQVQVEGLTKERDTFKANSEEFEKKLNDASTKYKDYDSLVKFKADTEAKVESTKRIDFLKSKGCKHPDLFESKLDFTKGTYNDNTKTYEGLDDAVKALQESYSDMFTVEPRLGKQPGKAAGADSELAKAALARGIKL